ncbi:hypothetical protein V6N13_050945 [Hibiscus sabdariffa]
MHTWNTSRMLSPIGADFGSPSETSMAFVSSVPIPVSLLFLDTLSTLGDNGEPGRSFEDNKATESTSDCNSNAYPSVPIVLSGGRLFRPPTGVSLGLP